MARNFAVVMMTMSERHRNSAAICKTEARDDVRPLSGGSYIRKGVKYSLHASSSILSPATDRPVTAGDAFSWCSSHGDDDDGGGGSVGAGDDGSESNAITRRIQHWERVYYKTLNAIYKLIAFMAIIF